MEYTRKTYVEFLFANDSLTQEVKNRDVSKIKIPKNAFCFYFFDILSIIVSANGNEAKFTGKRVNVSPKYYYGGKLYTIDELKRDFPNKRIFIRSIENDGYKKVIKCRSGVWYPFKETDIFIKEVLR
jgi:uncharacterized protein (UPF0128 family)